MASTHIGQSPQHCVAKLSDSRVEQLPCHVEREVYTRDTVTGLLGHSRETAFYMANATLTADRAADAIRRHWGIKNTLHYGRDVTFGEDRLRIHTNPGVFARLRSFAFDIFKCLVTIFPSHLAMHSIGLFVKRAQSYLF